MTQIKQQLKGESREDHYPGSDAEFPIFLLGTGRCGSTLLQKILNSVDNVAIYGEHGGFLKQIAAAYFLNLEDKMIEKYIMSQNAAGKDPLSVFQTLKNPQLWSAWTNWYNRETVRSNFRDFIESFFNPISLEQKVHWGFKEIRYGLDDQVPEMLADLYADGRFVFIVRHPVHVVASKISARASDGIEADAHTWVAQNTSFLNFCRVHSERSKSVHYEEIISNNSKELSHLFDWLGFSLSDRQKDIIKTTKPRYKGRPKPAKLTHDEVNSIQKITQELRNELGYS
ncbi:MAG: sulfotransferase [Syntrophobacterales bacterium]